MYGLLAVLVLVVATEASAQSGDSHWPPQAPEPAGWSYESGSPGAPQKPVVLANATIEYVLYSSPERPMLYGLSNYRVIRHRQTGTFAYHPAYRGRETVVWMSGQRGSEMRIFSRVPHRSWRTAWLIRQWRWVELPCRSPAWTAEQGIVLRLWSVHALMQSHGQAPLSVQF